MATSVLLRLLLALSAKLASGQCVRTDDACWAARATELTNAFRVQAGAHPLATAGSEGLSNARAHSASMAARQRLFHQPLETASVGCGLALCAENVATAHDTTDYAGVCVQLWVESKPHRANLLEAAAVSVAFGAVERDGQVWCTQTFLRRDGEGKCDAGGRRTQGGMPMRRKEPMGKGGGRRSTVDATENEKGQKCYRICV